MYKQVSRILASEQSNKISSSHPTIFHDVVQNSELLPGESRLERAVDEGQTVVAAGQVTTTHYLNTTAFHILANPDVLRKLKAELAASMPDSTVLSLDKLEQLPYLSAVVTEGFRISYGVTHRLQRVSPNAPLAYGKYIIPPGTPVGMTSIFMHDNPEHFPDPRTFKPERWLDPNARRDLSKYLVNFTRGTRGCLGQYLAQAEIYLCLAALFRRFEFELYETTRNDIDVAHDFFNPLPRKGSVGLRVTVV